LAQTGDTKQVGLVIAFPNGTTHTEIVTVPADAKTVDVLNASQVNAVTSETSFGPALCKINDTGCPLENCFCDTSFFWAYSHLNDRAWAAATEGIGVHVPADKTVEGFAWTDSDAQFNPKVLPPVFTFDELQARQTPPATIPQTGAGSLLSGGVILGSGLMALGAYLLRLRRQEA